MKPLIYLSIVISLLCTPQTIFAFTVNDPAYQVETYITYDTTNIGRSFDFTFDSAGNIYIVHTFPDTYTHDGSVLKISTDKTITILRSDLVDPRHIVWTGGTVFGDNLYITDKLETATYGYKGEVTKIDLAGNKTPFCGGLNQPASLAIDRTGNYSDLLYIANSASDKILNIGPSGGIANTFSNYPYNVSGAISGIAFDTTGNYKGKMFVATKATYLQYAGLFQIDTNGVESRYTNIEQACSIAFDDTTEQLFDGKMFAAGRQDSDTLWTLYQINGYYDTEVFGSFEISSSSMPPDIEFGPDGAMYVMEWSYSGQTTISRITPALQAVIVPIDIKPQSCPNPLNVKSNGVLPVAILGSADVDVKEIDLTSLEIFGIKPIRSSYKDVASPVTDALPEDCLCNTDGPDGYLDLTLKFDTQEIVNAIGPVNDDDYVVLTLTGSLTNGTLIEGADCVWIIKKERKCK